MRLHRIIPPFFTFLLTLWFFSLHAQGPEAKAQDQEAVSAEASVMPEVLNFSSTQAEGTLYFKSNIAGLERDVHLLLEKEEDGKEKVHVVDTRKGVGTDKEMPILYCFKDENPDSQVRFYRLRAIWFDEEGEYQERILAEKRFRNQLLSLNER